MRFWVDVEGEDELFAIDAMTAVVMESGALVFMDSNSRLVAAFHKWDNVMDDHTSNIEVPDGEVR